MGDASDVVSPEPVEKNGSSVASTGLTGSRKLQAATRSMVCTVVVLFAALYAIAKCPDQAQIISSMVGTALVGVQIVLGLTIGGQAFVDSIIAKASLLPQAQK